MGITTSADTPTENLIPCPFCHEPGYTLRGLKMHLELKWCEVYEKLEKK